MSDPSATFRAILEARAAEAGVILPPVVEPFESYYRLLSKWNAKINLTALPLDVPSASTVDRLFVEPLLAAGFVDAAHKVWFDLGSGNGSPAIPIKLARSWPALTMVEATAKKAAFLRETVHLLGLAETKVLTCRIEELRSKHGETADLITMRGVRLDSETVQVCRSLLRSAGHLITFGRTADLPDEYFRFAGRQDAREGQSTVTLWARV